MQTLVETSGIDKQFCEVQQLAGACVEKTSRGNRRIRNRKPILVKPEPIAASLAGDKRIGPNSREWHVAIPNTVSASWPIRPSVL